MALWAVPVSDLGGVARHVLDVGRHGLPGWDLVLLCPPGPLAQHARDAGIVVRTAPFGPAAGTLTSMRTLWRLRRALRPAVVHTHLAHADVVAALVGPGPAGRLVSTEHGIAVDDEVYHASGAVAATMAGVHRLRQHRVDGTILVAHATREAVRTKWRPPAGAVQDVIPNGIDRPEPVPTRRPGLHIAAVSRLAPEKRIEDLIDAFALIATDHPDARLTIAGTGALRAELGRRVDAAGLTDRVEFPGHVDAREIFDQVDVVAMPSVFENCSYTLLEAAARGCGVVATDVGGNAEILPPECLVRFGDPDALAATILEQGRRPDRRPGLPRAWPTVAEMCTRTVAFYARLGAHGEVADEPAGPVRSLA